MENNLSLILNLQFGIKRGIVMESDYAKAVQCQHLVEVSCGNHLWHFKDFKSLLLEIWENDTKCKYQ